MSPSVDIRSEQRQKNVSYYFRLGSLPLLFFVFVTILSLFIYTGTIAPSGQDAVLNKEKYQYFAMWYVLLGLFALALLGFATGLARKAGGISAAGDVFYLDDPSKSYKDFLAIGLCTFGGLGLFVIIRAAGLAQSIDIPEPVLQLVVAGQEEFAFRFVIPIFLFLVLAELHPNRDVVFFAAIFISGGIFSLFHLFAYSFNPYIDTETILMTKLFAAFVAGVWSSMLYYVAVRIGGGGEWALLGLVIGHYGFNLMNLNINPQVIVVYMLVAYVGIFFLMLLLGYFDTIIKPSSHAPRQNTNRKGPLTRHYHTAQSKKNIGAKMNKNYRRSR